jgi:MOSC domain-containing protein YiiM
MKNGKVIAIKSSKKKGMKKTRIEEGNFIADFGLEGDIHAGHSHRQISLLGTESAKEMQEFGVKGLCSGKFSENLTTEGILLWELPVGTQLEIGETIQEVTQIGKECHPGCAILAQGDRCVMPTQGIFTRIIKGGRIVVGDMIAVVKEVESMEDTPPSK